MALVAFDNHVNASQLSVSNPVIFVDQSASCPLGHNLPKGSQILIFPLDEVQQQEANLLLPTLEVIYGSANIHYLDCRDLNGSVELGKRIADYLLDLADIPVLMDMGEGIKSAACSGKVQLCSKGGGDWLGIMSALTTEAYLLNAGRKMQWLHCDNH